jgi:hypothetical protein
LIILTGCSIKDVKDVREESVLSDEEILRERLMAYYNYRVNQEYDKSYEYEDPLYRKTVKLTQYTQRLAVSKAQWKAANVEELKIEDGKADITLRLRVKVLLLNQVAMAAKNIEHDTSVKEAWIKVDGQWYHAFKAKAND